jgi:hypothetical protein
MKQKNSKVIRVPIKLALILKRIERDSKSKCGEKQEKAIKRYYSKKK